MISHLPSTDHMDDTDFRATEILNALIEQTGQVDYDEDTINNLINEYESLMY